MKKPSSKTYLFLFITITISALLFSSVNAALFSTSKKLKHKISFKGQRVGILAEPDPQQLNVIIEGKSSMGLSMMGTSAGAANDRKNRNKLNRVVDSTEVQKELYQSIVKALSKTGSPITVNENLYITAHPKALPVTAIDGYKIPDFKSIIKSKQLDYLLYIRYSAGLGSNGGPFAKSTAYIEGRFYLLNAKVELLATESYNTRSDFHDPMDAQTAIGNPSKFRKDLRSAMQQFSKTICSRLKLGCV